MQVTCPKCERTISGADLNIATDVARCSHCNEIFPLSALVSSSDKVDVQNPPRGAWYQNEFNGFEVGATTRHPIAFFLVPFLCVWSGFSLGTVYGTQIAAGQFNPCFSVFGLPFLLGSLWFGAYTMMTICGKVVVQVRDSEGTIFTGVGPIGWTRRFHPAEVRLVRIEAYRGINQNHSRWWIIALDGPQKLRFGSILTDARRDFVAGVLRQQLPRLATRYGAA